MPVHRKKAEKVGIRFSETMSGYVVEGVLGFEEGEKKGRDQGYSLSFDAVIEIESVADFIKLSAREEYRDYRLVVEYKWGSKTYGSETVRNSGILLHAIGPDGNPSPWMSSIECQVAQGCVGDFIVIRGKNQDGSKVPVTITSDTILGPDGNTRWKKGGKPTVYTDRQFW